MKSASMEQIKKLVTARELGNTAGEYPVFKENAELVNRKAQRIYDFLKRLESETMDPSVREELEECLSLWK